MADNPEVSNDSAQDEDEVPIPTEVTDPETQRQEEANARRAQLREAFSKQLQKRLPKKPTIKRPQTVLTGIDADKYGARCLRGDDPNFSIRLHAYNMHRYRIKMVTPVVDTSPPIVARNHYSKPSNFNRRLMNFTRIERENALMVRRIAGILEGRSMLDNRLSWIGNGEGKSKRFEQMKFLDIALSNLALLKRLQQKKPVIETQQLLAEYRKNEELMERVSMYPLYWKKPSLKGWEAHVNRALSRAATVSVFLTLATETERLGTIVIELNFGVTPMTSENFLCLCTGEKGLSYKCSQIHRIVPGILWQGGDVTGQDGFGNKSIYGNTFPDENFILKHNDSGVVSMANCGPDTNGSQFIITARSTPALDGTNVVFGKVTSGMEVLEKLNDYLGSTGVPKCDIFIQDCGIMESSDQTEPEQGRAESRGSNLDISQDNTDILKNSDEKEN